MEKKENCAICDDALKREKTKKLSIKEGCAFSLMDGFGLRYISAYALALGANNNQIALLTSIPTLLGNLSQLFSSKIIEKYSRKKLLIFSVFLQSLIWLPLIAIGFFFFYKDLNSNTSSNFVILIYTILIICGAILSPAWNSLMSDIVTKDKGKYFGTRNKILGAVALVAMLFGGFILDYFKHTQLFIGFAIIFGMSFIGRAISAYLFTKHYEPELKFEKGYYFSFRQFVKKIPESNFGKFSVFVALIMFATAIASPFFSVYMLKDLHFSYITYTIIIISSFISPLIFMPIWGKFADKYGNLRVIKITGFYIPFIPLVWFVSPLVAEYNMIILVLYLFIMELVSGAMWAGFNLAVVNFIYDAVTRQRVALCVAYYNVLNGIGIFIGATIGGFIASHDFVIFGLTPILLVFLLSAIARFIVYFAMISKLKEVREVETFDGKKARKDFIKETREELMYFSYRWMKPNR
ncbi:MAG: MFS transporter [Nanoarchaeota archaeon]|nr:MFS transporter [Nanoarchaeota archaeon]